MIAPARRAAYESLVAVLTDTVDLATSLERARRRLDDPRDRALATEIATGTERWRATLDHFIRACSGRELDRIDPEILTILRLSLYQLRHLSRVPAAAVVDDAVGLAKQAGKRSAGAFVNAVLRTWSRRRHALGLPPRPANTDDRQAALAYLSVTLSHPRWLVERWLDRVGFERAERWLQFNNAVPPVTLRPNRLRTSPEDLVSRLRELGLTVERGRYAPDALIVTRRAGGEGARAGEPLAFDRGALRGLAVVQDEASQLMTLLAGPHPGPRVFDTCAAPGSKTTALAAALAPGGSIVACDVRSRRLRMLRHALDEAGATGVHLVQADLCHPAPFTTTFDCVFVDAPCSGLGTLRRDPDIKWRRQPHDLEAMARTQRQLLRHAAAAVSPGGRLVYATCSTEPEEDDDIADYAAAIPGFHRVDARDTHPALPPSVVDATGAVRTTPYDHDLEGFYGAAFDRSAAEG